MHCVNYRDYIANQSLLNYCSLACGVAKGGYKGSNDDCCCQSALPCVCGKISLNVGQERESARGLMMTVVVRVLHLVFVATSLPP